MYMFHLDTLLLESALNKWQSKQYKCSKFWKNTFNDGLLALSTLSLKLVIHHMTHCYSRVDVRYLAWLLLHEQDFDPKMNFGFDATQSIHLPLALWDLSLPIAGGRRYWEHPPSFNDAASPFLLQRAWLSSSSEEKTTLTAISRYRIFSKYIKEMYYDGTIYDPELLNVSKDDRCHRKYVHKFLRNETKIVWCKNAIRYAVS